MLTIATSDNITNYICHKLATDNGFKSIVCRYEILKSIQLQKVDQLWTYGFLED